MRKSLVCLVLAMFLMVTNVFAGSGAIENFYLQNKNYTADCSVNITFENSENVIALLKEIQMPEEVSYFVDMEMFLKSLLSYDGKMTMNVDIGENYDKIKLGIGIDGNHNINLNPNLKANVKTKTGFWFNMDLAEETPVFDMIVSLPYMNRYLKLDAVKFMEAENLEVLKALYNKEMIETINLWAVENLEKYAEVKMDVESCVIKFDNEGLGSYLNEYVSFISNFISNVAGMEDESSLEMIDFAKFRLLGDGGLECVYKFENGKIVSGEIKADVLIDLEGIYSEVYGEEWYYDADGELKFILESEMKYSNAGSTKVEYPVLTEENTIPEEEMYPDVTIVDDEESTGYPLPYVSGWCAEIPVIDGDIYVPLRLTVEEAYGDGAKINFENGVVTIESEYFPEFKKLMVTINSDKVYADEKEYSFTDAILINDRTYVNKKMFEEIFGWELSYAQYELVSGECYYGFYTQEW